MDQLLVALDVETRDAGAATRRRAARRRSAASRSAAGCSPPEGPSIVRALTERGDRVFLDLKFHDIPNTVATAVAAATALGVWMVNVHAGGGTAMMRAARDAAHETAAQARHGRRRS